nr:hypothetical protein [Streptococcus gallolyticus]
MNDYEYLVRRLEKFVNILNNIGSSIEKLKTEHNEKFVKE